MRQRAVEAAKGAEKGVSEELGEARRWTGESRTSCVVRVCLRARRTAGEGRRWPPAGVCASAQRTPTSLQQAALRLLVNPSRVDEQEDSAADT